jgi:hypoxanthine phosphoribosyltransferase
VSEPGSPAALLTQEQIAVRVHELAQQISADYVGRELLVVGVLKGSWIFLADLVRQMTVPVTVDFVMASSYGAGTDSCGSVRIVLDLQSRVEGRDVLLVDDILDSGLTLKCIVADLKRRNPRSVRVAALLDKPERRRAEVKVDYIGFSVPNKFVVGYGVDLAERFRNLPYIGYLEEPEAKG